MVLRNHTPRALEVANLKLAPEGDTTVDEDQLKEVVKTTAFLGWLSKGEVSILNDEHFAEMERRERDKRVAELEEKQAQEAASSPPTEAPKG